MSADEPHVDPEGCGANAAPYVLGALTEEEHEAFRRHIESCAVCREEVAALALVASALPAAAPQLSAPPELKRRVMSSVHEDARRRASKLAGGRGASDSAGAPQRTARAWLRWRPNLAAAALVAAVIALAVVVLVPGGGGGGTRVIRAEVLVPRASASLRVSDGHAQLSVAGMPQSAPGRVYQLWTKRSPSGPPVPTDALFTVAADGAASVGVPGSVAGVSEVMVTSEPLGGSRVPTTPPVIVARVG
jgi:anti-sigma-K factor RskA